MDPIRKEQEAQKRRWEENVRKMNEEKERKELERKRQIELKKKEQQKLKLEEMKIKNQKILEEEKQLLQSDKKKLNQSQQQDIGESQDTIANSQNTDYNMLDSLINQKQSEKDLNSKSNLNDPVLSNDQRELHEFLKYEELARKQEEEERNKEVQINEDFMKTDQTMAFKNQGRFYEESDAILIPQIEDSIKDSLYLSQSKKYNNEIEKNLRQSKLEQQDAAKSTIKMNIVDFDLQKNSENQVIRQSIQQLKEQENLQMNQVVNSKQKDEQQQPPLSSNQQKKSKKDEFLMKMDLESQMKKIKKQQQAKKLKEEEEIMKKKQEILAQVLGIGSGGGKQQELNPKIQNYVIDEQDNEEEYKSSKNSNIQNSQQQQQQRVFEYQVRGNELNSGSKEEASSINDRDSDYDEDDYVAHNPHKLGATSYFPGQKKPISDQSETESEIFNYSDDKNSSSQLQSNYLTEESKKSVKSRLQSASQKNREQYYEKYNMDMSVQSQDFDQLYQHGHTHILNELNRTVQSEQKVPAKKSVEMGSFGDKAYGGWVGTSASGVYGGAPLIQDAETESQVKALRDNIVDGNTKKSNILTFGKNGGENNNIEASSSFVKIEASMNPNEFKPEDLPEDLREYEQKILQQLDEVDQYEDDFQQDYGEEQDQYSPEQKYVQSELKQPKQNLINQRDIQPYARSQQRPLDIINSKFEVSLGYKDEDDYNDHEEGGEIGMSYGAEDGNDPLKEYYRLMKKHQQNNDQSRDQDQDEEQDDFYNQFENNNSNIDQDKSTQQLNDSPPGKHFTHQVVEQNDHFTDDKDEYSPEKYQEQRNQNDRDQAHDDEYANDNNDDINNESEEELQDHQMKGKGVALDIGIDEGTMKAKKMKKFEEFKQRKMQELEQRKRDRSNEKAANAIFKRQPTSPMNQKPQKNEEIKRDKSPIQNKANINREKSPIANKNNNQKDKQSPYVNRKQPKDRSQNRIQRRPVASDQNEEDKDSEMTVSQSKLENIKKQPLAAHVPPHILKKQQQRQQESTTPQQNQTPKMTPQSNPSAKQPKATSNFVKNSNKKIIRNAIQVCLAGETNKAEREQVLKIIDETDYPYYIIMFRGNLGRQDYKAMYYHDGSGYVERIHGPSNVPEVIEDKMIDKFFRYDSSNKVFKEISGIKSLTLTTDALILKKEYIKKTTNAMNQLY